MASTCVVDVLAVFPHCKQKMSWMSVGLSVGSVMCEMSTTSAACMSILIPGATNFVMLRDVGGADRTISPVILITP